MQCIRKGKIELIDKIQYDFFEMGFVRFLKEYFHVIE